MRDFTKKFNAFLHKERVLTFRTYESFLSILFFAFLLVLLLSFGFSGQSQAILPLVGPLLWLSTLFGGMLRLNRSYDPENEGHVLEMLKLVKGLSIPFFLSKLVINLFFLFLLEVVIYALIVILFNVREPVIYLQKSWIVYVLGTIGLGFIGTTFSGMLISHSRKEMILPMISYPILIPLIMAVLKSIIFSVDGNIIGLEWTWVRILIGFDIIYGVLSLMVFDSLLRA